MKKSIEAWLNDEPETVAHIGLGTYKSHHTIVIDTETSNGPKVGEMKFLDLVEKVPSIIDDITRRQFNKVRDKVVSLVVGRP